MSLIYNVHTACDWNYKSLYKKCVTKHSMESEAVALFNINSQKHGGFLNFKKALIQTF